MTTNLEDGGGGTTANPPVLSVHGLSKRFGGVVALRDVSLELRPGEVHCLAGENGSGKSTLIKIISGAEVPDSGRIVVDGESRSRMDTTSAIENGIQVIYQDFSLFPNLTVAENIVITSAVAERHKFYNAGQARTSAMEIVEELQLDLDLDTEVGDLSVANRQLTAICRAMISKARVIIMDEPTTALTHAEVANLFVLVNKLRDRGVALLFVSHKLNEVLRISQRVTIMRSGAVVTSGPVEDFNTKSITHFMTGHDIDDVRTLSELPPEATVRLDVADLTLPGAYRNVTFQVRKGEILGITGLLGSGRTEIAESLFGIMPAAHGTVRIDGEVVTIGSIRDAVGAGIGYVPEDRLTQGLFMQKSIADNIVASSLQTLRTKMRLLDRRRIRGTIDRLFQQLHIQAPTAKAAVRTLSGGNAQRVVLAKWLATNPKILILNGPTVGVDVGSKAQILDLLREQARQGMAVIIISDDELELVACCHRVIVVTKGQLSGELMGDNVSVETIQDSMAV